MKSQNKYILLFPVLLVLIWIIRHFSAVWYPGQVDPINPERLASISISDIQTFITVVSILIFLGFVLTTELKSNEDVDEDTEISRIDNKWIWKLSVVISLGILIMVNFVINPWSLYPTKLFSPRIENSRYQKIQMLDSLSFDPDIIVLGSSRSVGFPAAYIEDHTGASAFNSAVFGARPYDYDYITEYIYDRFQEAPSVFFVEVNGILQLKPETIYINTPFSLVKYLPFEEKVEWFEKRYENLFSITYLSEALYTIRYQNIYSDELERWEQWEFDELGSGTRPANPFFEETLQDRVENKDNITCYFDSQIPFYDRLIKLIRENDGKIIFYTVPYHPRYYQVLLSSDNYLSCVNEAKNYFDEAGSEYGGIYYWDFDDLAAINGIDTEQGFYDSQHITPQNAKILIDSLLQDIEKALQQ